MATLINLGSGAGSTNGDTLFQAFTKINTNYSDLESISNKSINVTTDGASDNKYPSVKAVKTYVDANSGGVQVTKVLKTTITSAQVLQLFTTPRTVLPAASSEKVNIPTNIYIKRNAGTAYTLYNSLALLDGLDIDTQTQISTNPLSNTTVGFMNNTIYLSGSASGNTTSAPYKLKALDGNPTGGTGDLDVYITYIEITL